MDTQKFILDRIASGALFKHMERDYSIFFLSSFGDGYRKSNAERYGNGGLTIAFMMFRNLVSSHWRLENDNEIFLKNIADNIYRHPKIKDEIFLGYSDAGEEMLRIYSQIEEKDQFDSKFVKHFAATIDKLITYQACILHRADSFVKQFEKTPGVADEIYSIRKKYESVFGRFETMFELLAKKIVKSIPGATLNDMKHLTASEIVDMLETRVIPKDLIGERNKLTVVSYLPKLEIFTGKQAEEIYEAVKANEEKYHPIENVKEIIGKSIYGTGKITGQCQVITDYDKVESLKEGNILVTPSTLPKYNNVYKRAKAIITNEGGILAHAAILCREFKIPGIIGTKIATKVLKDGDMVEVNTEKGTVRIIKKI